MKIKVSFLSLALIMLVSLAVCSTYYKVKDPSSNNVYYTEKIKKKMSGAIEFKDTATGNEIIIQNSEILEIDKNAYNSGIAELTAPATEVAPAVEAAPATESAPAVEATPATESAPAVEETPATESLTD